MRIISCFLFSLLLASSNVYANDEILLVTGEYAPYVEVVDGKVSGLVPEIVGAALKNQKVQFRYQLQPWNRCEYDLKTGRAFGAFPYLVNKERAEKYHFSDELINFYPKFLYIKDRFSIEFKWRSISDFSQYIIGGVSGYWYEGVFKRNKLNVQYAASDRTNIKKLMLRRVDFTLIDELVGQSLIKEIYPDKLADFAFTKRPERVTPFRVMVSKNFPESKQLLLKLNAGIKKIKSNGKYNEILQKYNISPNYAVK